LNKKKKKKKKQIKEKNKGKNGLGKITSMTGVSNNSSHGFEKLSVPLVAQNAQA
jgi:hypothetical protein